MSKPVTLNDLKKALQPIVEALEFLNLNNENSNTQISEIHALVTNLHTKVDVLDQKTEEAEETLPPKKSTRKAATKKVTKKPAKKGVKRAPKKTSSVDEPDEVDEADASDAETDGDGDGDGDGDEAEETDASESSKSTKRKPVKKVTTKKKKTAKKVVKKTRPPNKSEYFTKMYNDDNEFFSTYITDEVKEEIAEENEEDWDGKTDTQLAKLQCKAYYHYMKDNHDAMLQSMKQAYNEDQAKKTPVIATKEED